MQIDVQGSCNVEDLSSPADSMPDENENQKKQDNASRFADALSRIGDLCRGVPMTLSLEQYLKRDEGMNNCTSKKIPLQRFQHLKFL